ncbi:hypothetical protein L596_000267 [Steinernema carpocapsae]|uniref:Protein kinase domain-containing protein n=1 Tax=Steinernema carpocapsae TaxID=34508 RepID=A0A4U8UHG6_STECR|nr:hypothetical protein L596_000267 [Steinernema carpocapsae]
MSFSVVLFLASALLVADSYPVNNSYSWPPFGDYVEPPTLHDMTQPIKSVPKDNVQFKELPKRNDRDHDSDEHDPPFPHFNDRKPLTDWPKPEPPPPHPLAHPPYKYTNKYDSKYNKHELNQDEENARSLALALGIGIPCLIAVISLLVIGYFFYRRWKRKQRAGSIYASAASPIMVNQNVYSKPLCGKVSGSSENTDIWALTRQNLEISYEKKLGSGAFCNVFYGRIIGTAPICIVNPNLISASRFKDCEVAIKMLPSFADDIARSDFQQEINFMKSLSYHPHLVSMLGYVVDPKNPMLVVEFCSKGDLLHLIRSKKTEVISAYENGTGMRIKDLLSFAWQISNGLEYLGSVGCIHRDIALRNVLIDSDSTCKIADFGLCRLTDNLLYTARGGRLPLRWMAPESLRLFEYSFQSDVWSYGILLHELFTFGEVPYGAIDNADILEFLDADQRLEKPVCCPPEIYSIMRLCWAKEGSDRPSFAQICQKFVQIIESAQPDYGYIQASSGES